MARSDRIQSQSHFRLPAPILPLMLAILPVLLAILAPTCPTSALKMPEKCHLGANIAKQTLQPPFLAPQNTKNLMFSLSFCKFSAIQPMCQNTPKMLPTCSQNLPSWVQDRQLGAIMAHLGRNLLPTWPQLRPSCAHLRANLRRNS